jgi:hypothetical protein
MSALPEPVVAEVCSGRTALLRKRFRLQAATGVISRILAGHPRTSGKPGERS